MSLWHQKIDGSDLNDYEMKKNRNKLYKPFEMLKLSNNDLLLKQINVHKIILYLSF